MLSEVMVIGSTFKYGCFTYVNGAGSSIIAQFFEMVIHLLNFLTVGVGFWQTVDGHGSYFYKSEWLAVIIFTIEYMMRFVGAAADPEFSRGPNWFHV